MWPIKMMAVFCLSPTAIVLFTVAITVPLSHIIYQPLGKEPFRRWEPFGIHNSSGFPNRIPAISLKNVQVGAVPSSTVYLQPL